MSLKVVHVCFIILSILLAEGFGFWAFRDYETSQNALTRLLGIGSFVGGGILVGYLFWFLSKMKRVGSE